jgi:hypothetical protein
MALRGGVLVGLATICGLASRLHLLDQPPTPVFDEYVTTVPSLSKYQHAVSASVLISFALPFFIGCGVAGITWAAL